jgi:hypothetical protein
MATAVVFAALGNPAVVDAVRDADAQAISLTVVGFANWDYVDAEADIAGGLILRVAVTVVVAALLCALAGRGRSRASAFIGGWGALVVAAGVAGALFHVYQTAVVTDGETFGVRYADLLVDSANRGAAFGLWTGWFVGLVVALATRPAHAVAPSTAGRQTAASPPVADSWAAAGTAAPATAGGPHIVEPPPPWWAPTGLAGNDPGVRPGPTAFPPGGFGASGARPVAPGGPPVPSSAGAAAAQEMTTVSGDPHPSDPDATQAVGMPSGDEQEATAPETTALEATAPPGTAPPGTAPAGTSGSEPAAGSGINDPDATTAMEPGDRDHTIPMPRQPD